MRRRVFYSFHYDDDNWRLWQVRQMGAVEGQRIVQAGEWEQIERKPEGVKRWIDEQMHGKSCVVVLIGANTWTRRWVDYEIRKAWDSGKGVLGLHVHNLKDVNGRTTAKGISPFATVALNNGKFLSDYVPIFDPQGYDSRAVYAVIEGQLPAWIDYAIKVREAANPAPAPGAHAIYR